MITIDDGNIRKLKEVLSNNLVAEGDIQVTKEGSYPFPLEGGLAELQDLILLARQRGDEKVVTVLREVLAAAYPDSDETSLDEHYAVPILEINPVSKEMLATQWIQILPLGEIHTVDGRSFKVTETGLKKMMATWESHKTELVVDYEHNSLNPFAQENPAAGWVEGLEVQEDGVYAMVRWTKRAKAKIEAREYRYISPVVGLDTDTEEAVALYSVAVTNTPAIDGMQPLAASQTVIAGAAPEFTVTTTNIANLNQGDTEMIEALAADLGVEANVEALKGKFIALQAEIAEKDEELVKATTKLVELSSEKVEMELNAILDDAIENGKIAESQRDALFSLGREHRESFDQILAASPEGVHRPPQDVVMTQEALSAAAEARVIDINDRNELHKHALQLSQDQGIPYQDAVNRIYEEARNE